MEIQWTQSFHMSVEVNVVCQSTGPSLILKQIEIHSISMVGRSLLCWYELEHGVQAWYKVQSQNELEHTMRSVINL